jgi:hypothetical protein
MVPDYLSLWPVEWFKCDREDRDNPKIKLTNGPAGMVLPPLLRLRLSNYRRP